MVSKNKKRKQKRHSETNAQRAEDRQEKNNKPKYRVEPKWRGKTGLNSRYEKMFMEEEREAKRSTSISSYAYIHNQDTLIMVKSGGATLPGQGRIPGLTVTGVAIKDFIGGLNGRGYEPLFKKGFYGGLIMDHLNPKDLVAGGPRHPFNGFPQLVGGFNVGEEYVEGRDVLHSYVQNQVDTIVSEMSNVMNPIAGEMMGV